MVGTKRKTILPKAPAGRLLMDAGAKRVSADAIDAFTHVLEEIGISISKQAARIALHSGRKTVKEEDIVLALKR